MAYSPQPARVVHQCPGRTRIRLPRPGRDPATMAKAKEACGSIPGVHQVEVNPTTGSLLLHHRGSEPDIELLSGELEAAVGFMLDLAPPRQRPRARGEVSVLARNVRTGFAELDARIAEATGGWLDLKMAVPLALLGAAALQVIATEGSLGVVPPYLLAYYAFDTFLKFNESISPDPSELEGEERPT